MGTSLEWKIVVGERRFTSGHRTLEEKRKTAAVMEERSDGLHEKQKHGRIFGVWEWMDGSWLYRPYKKSGILRKRRKKNSYSD